MDDIEPDAIDTPEGRAIYPFGAWGSGYLADAATERRLRAYLGRMTWVVVAFLGIQSFIRHFLLPVPVPELAALAATLVALWVFHYAVIKIILHKTARSSVRPTSHELIRLRVARHGRVVVASGLVSAIFVFGAVAILTSILAGGFERWAFALPSSGPVLAAIVGLWRLSRIRD